MDNETPEFIPPELRVVLDLEMAVEGLESAVNHQKVQDVLADVPGVESVSILEGKIAIQYDPEKVTKARLTELISSAGFSISGSASAPPSPPVDSQA